MVFFFPSVALIFFSKTIHKFVDDKKWENLHYFHIWDEIKSTCGFDALYMVVVKELCQIKLEMRHFTLIQFLAFYFDYFLLQYVDFCLKLKEFKIITIEKVNDPYLICCVFH